MYPFHNAWPEYSNEAEFYNDFVYTVWASPTNIHNFTNYLATVPVHQGQINAQLCISNSQKMKSDYQRQFPPECQGRPSYNAYGINMSPAIPHAYLKDQDPNSRMQALQKVMTSHLPLKFEEFVAQELMVSIDQANDMIFEYRRFLLLSGITAYKLYPSEQIEKVWLIHMAHGTNYIKFCNDSINFVPYHVPFTGNTSGYNDRQEYDNTLTFYSAVFNEAPCTSCWPPGDFRFQVENFQCMFVNLIRLAGMYWANMQGHLTASHELKPRGHMENDPQYNERKDKIKAKKKHKGGSGAGTAAAAGIGAGVVLGVGGLAMVANPNTANYNEPTMMDHIVDGFHDGLSVLTDISFDDLMDAGEGVLGAFEGIDWPDIDFDGFADAAGDLFGDAGEFFAEAGEHIVEGIGNVIGEIGGWFD